MASLRSSPPTRSSPCSATRPSPRWPRSWRRSAPAPAGAPRSASSRTSTPAPATRIAAATTPSTNSSRFSRAGTLIATAETFVNHAEAGHFADELDNLLGVGTQDALCKLVADARLTRHKLAGQFLYCAADRPQQTHQVRARRLLLATPGLGQPLPDADLMPEELRAAIVLFASLLDERQRRLFAGLEAFKCGWGGDRRIARPLGIDPSTVAAGRRQLVERDVEVDRVRRADGGRTPTAMWSSRLC